MFFKENSSQSLDVVVIRRKLAKIPLRAGPGAWTWKSYFYDQGVRTLIVLVKIHANEIVEANEISAMHLGITTT